MSYSPQRAIWQDRAGRVGRRDLVTGLAATVAASAVPGIPATVAQIPSPYPVFVSFIGPVISNCAGRQYEDQALMRILRSGYWFVARQGDDVLAIRHSRTGVIFERVLRENDNFAIRAIAIAAGKRLPDAMGLARIGRAARFAAIDACQLCAARSHEGGIFVQYPATGDLGKPRIGDSRLVDA